ncbi:MAG: SpoIIE family protein phosphatase [Pseudomonadota bacterium]
MTNFPDVTPNDQQVADAAEPALAPVVLVVDDSRLQRRILSLSLKKWGFKVLEAESGQEALDLVQENAVDVILSDWMMPGMSGPEFCSAYRALPDDNYGYFILLTSKTEKTAVTEGLDNGADDFLSKPVDVTELRARINAGQRILAMQRQIATKNRMLETTLHELQTLNAAIDRDLEQACILQKALMPEAYAKEDAYAVTALFRPSGHVGGDLVGHRVLPDGKLAFWSVDVSGHGIASALITIRLSSLLSEQQGDRSLLGDIDDDAVFQVRPPGDVFGDLNRILCSELETDHYLTMFLGIFDPVTGVLTFGQAGHPNPALQGASGDVRFFGHGGMPIGLLDVAQYDDDTITLKPGDRLFAYSDGLTECENPDGGMLDEDGLARILQRHPKAKGADFNEKVLWDLADFADGRAFGDDISAILLEVPASKKTR